MRRAPTRLRDRALLALLPLLVVGIACVGRKGPSVGAPGYTQRGVASWYGPGFDGRRTANGEVYDMNLMTAAHKQLPFDTVVEVRNRHNGKKVEVRINDRGPFVGGRIIDLSYAAAQKIEMVGPGTAKVEIAVTQAASAAGASASAWLVQAGAFESMDRALALARDLRPDFPEVDVHTEGSLHRVLLGPYKKRDKAAKVKGRLDQRGIGAFLVAIRD